VKSASSISAPSKSVSWSACPAARCPFLSPALSSNARAPRSPQDQPPRYLLLHLYHARAWGGIATSVTTVLVTGLSSTGAIKQRLIFRLLGSAIGGLIFGVGSTIFLFPHMDSITSLVVLEAVIAFISAWVAIGPKFNYIGLQMAFSFYVVA
jgi:hypothetical protein